MNTIMKLSELAAYMKRAVETYSQRDYEQLHQELCARCDQLIMEAFMDRHPGWSIVEGNAACMMYLYRNWSFSRRVEENVAQLSALANDITENYDDCDDKFLTVEAAAETMKVAERVYDFSKRVLCKQHLFIFLFHAKHRTEDSFCRCMNMTDGSVAADIYMLIPHKDHEATPQSMLLHELGHCVNIALTGDPEVPPEDFALIMKLIEVDKVECDIPEFFAHCFAMSLLIEPELLSVDPFKMVPQNHKQLFREYCQLKIQNL
ncbi:hypothetical protein [Lawsonibacter celer]|uniref:hypothetical protein n=1 Tax=Lawsonibacter celer TaxID=2986526 RepID=UPI001645CA5F|nr:hypothetical protein [Lawsonibacter celer]